MTSFVDGDGKAIAAVLSAHLPPSSDDALVDYLASVVADTDDGENQDEVRDIPDDDGDWWSPGSWWSWRAGGCSDYSIAGCPTSFIMQQGRWKSNAFLCYFRSTRSTLAIMSAKMHGKVLRQVAATLARAAPS